MSFRYSGILAAGFAAGLVTSVAACSTGDCDPSNCAGCCTGNGVCLRGDLAIACGTFANTCMACLDGACTESGCIGAAEVVDEPPASLAFSFFGPAPRAGTGEVSVSPRCEFQLQNLNPGCLASSRCGDTVRSMSCDDTDNCICRENNVAARSVTRSCSAAVSSEAELNSVCGFGSAGTGGAGGFAGGSGGAGGAGGAGGGTQVDPYANCSLGAVPPGAGEACRTNVNCGGAQTFSLYCSDSTGLCVCSGPGEFKSSTATCATRIESPRHLVETLCEMVYTP